jgi:dolichol-phosphate mannosyltransferase
MGSAQRRFSIVVPALNEEGNLEAAVDAIRRAFEPVAAGFEILIMDDASTDGTAAVAEKLARADPRVRVFHNKRRLNIGGSYKKALKAAQYEYFLMMPGDNQAKPEDLIPALEALDHVDLIAVYPRDQRMRTVGRQVLSNLYTRLVNGLFGTRFRYANGANVWKTERLRQIPIHTDGFSYQTEALVRGVRSGMDFVEAGIGIRERAYGRSTAASLRNWLKVSQSLLALWWDVRVVNRERYRTPGRKLTKPQSALSEAGRPQA